MRKVLDGRWVVGEQNESDGPTLTVSVKYRRLHLSAYSFCILLSLTI